MCSIKRLVKSAVIALIILCIITFIVLLVAGCKALALGIPVGIAYLAELIVVVFGFAFGVQNLD